MKHKILQPERERVIVTLMRPRQYHVQVVRQDTPEKMTALVEKISSQGGATRQQVREATARPKPGRPKSYVFAYRPPDKTFNLKLAFGKSRATRDDVISALEAILRELRKAK